MKAIRFFFLILAAGIFTADAQTVPIVEATNADMTAGTKGLPSVVTPRRAATLLSATYLPLAGGAMTGNITFSDTGEGLSLHGGGTITGASGALRFSGNMLLGGLTTDASPNFVLQLPNTKQLSWTNSSGAGVGVLQLYSDNIVYLDSPASTIFRTNGSTPALTLDSSQTQTNTGEIRTTGAASTFLASSAGIQYYNGGALITSTGANTSTNGTFTLRSQRSNGSNAIDVLSSDTSGNATFASRVIASAATVGATGYFDWTGQSVMRSPTDGTIKISNAAETDFTRLILGTNNSSGVAIKKNSTAINFRLADDSADAAITAGAGTFSGAVTVGSGTAITKVLSATATLDFASTGSGAVDDKTITVTGAAVGDTVAIGVPNGSVTATSEFSAWVSATNTVTVRFSPKATEDPASGTFRATVVQF